MQKDDLADRPSAPSGRDRLDSWKEIACYLNCSERTVRRWEEEGLPVHRHPHKKKSAIYAYRVEIDAWWCDGHERLKQIEESQGKAPSVQTTWLWWKRPWPVTWLALMAFAVTMLAWNPGGWRERLLRGNSSRRIQSLAVLPLQNLSHDPEQEYFADGMTDALITDLAQIGSLKVISRTSVLRYKKTDKSLPEIARELNVDGIIEGTVQRSGDRVRITAQLIEAPRDRHLWAQSYERDLRDVLALQNEVAGAIAREIKINVTPQEKMRLASARPVNLEAHEAYLKGRFFLNQRTPDGMRNAVAQFTEAVERDDGYALAYAGLSDSYSLLHYYYAKPRMEVMAQQKAAALKAVALDDSSAETHTSLAQTFVDEWSWPEAEKEFRRAIERNPNYSLAHLWYSWFLQYQGRLPEAVSEAQRALNLDPLGVVSNANLGYIYAEQREYDQAINQLEKSSQLNPDYADPHVELANVFFLNHQYPQGYAELARASELSGQKHFASCVQAAMRDYPSAHFLKSMEALAECRVRASRSDLLSSYDTAVDYAFAENQKKSLEWLERAYQAHDEWLSYLGVDPALEKLHHDPRFQDLLRRMNLPADFTNPNTRNN